MQAAKALPVLLLFYRVQCNKNRFLLHLFKVVDVSKDKCDEAYAYIADLAGNGVVVYSLKQDNAWRISHHYFHFEPLAGTYNISGVQVRWADGVFGLALSEPRENG